MLIFVSAYAYYVDLCWYSNHLQKSSWQWNLISDDTRKRCRTNSGDSVVAAFDWSCLFRGFLKCGIHKSPQILVKCSSTWMMTGGTPMTSETSIWGSWGSYSYEVLYLRHPLPCMWWTGGEVDHSVVFFFCVCKRENQLKLLWMVAKSCTTLGWNPINTGINHLPTGAGFLPSTVWTFWTILLLQFKNKIVLPVARLD